MTLRMIAPVSAALAASLWAAPAAAHHAFSAEFDGNQPITLKGTIAKVELINPHSWIHVDVKQSDGRTVRWMVEGGTPNTLLRRGVTKESLPIGEEIVVNGFRAKDGSNRANGQDVTFPDGRKLFVTGSAPDAAPEKR